LPAIGTSLRGQGYVEQLLLDALGKAVTASEIGGGRLIVVCIDYEAQSFYERYLFTPVRNRERRLVMKGVDGGERARRTLAGLGAAKVRREEHCNPGLALSHTQ